MKQIPATPASQAARQKPRLKAKGKAKAKAKPASEPPQQQQQPAAAAPVAAPVVAPPAAAAPPGPVWANVVLGLCNLRAGGEDKFEDKVEGLEFRVYSYYRMPIGCVCQYLSIMYMGHNIALKNIV